MVWQSIIQNVCSQLDQKSFPILFEWSYFTYFVGDDEVENPDLWADLVNETGEESDVTAIGALFEVDKADVFENIPGSILPSPTTPSPTKKARTGEY